MISIQSIISDVVVAMRTNTGFTYPYFEAGRIQYIIEKVAEKGQSPANRNKILPMIALIGDIKESITDGIKEATIPILFMVETRPETPNPTRYTTTFVTLYDLMDAFNLELGKSAYVNMTYPDFTKLDSAYYSGLTNKISVYTDILLCEYKIELIDSTECDYEEPASFSLVVSAGTGGTTEPAPATYTIVKGVNKAFYAVASTGYIFSKWVYDGVDSILNPILTTALNNSVLAAQFIVSGFTTILKTFHTAPVTRGNATYFGDYLGNDNDVLIKNMKVGYFASTYYIDSGLSISGLAACTLICSYKEVVNGSTMQYQQGLSIHAGLNRNGVGQLLFYTGNATYGYCRMTAQNPQIIAGVFYGAGATNADKMKIYINGILQTLTFNGTIPNTLPALSNNLSLGYDRNSGTYSVGWHTFGGAWNIALTQEQIIDYQGSIALSSCILAYAINHGNGSIIYNLKGGTNGTVVGATLATFWGSNSDEAIPYHLTLGCTIYTKNTAPTDTSLWIFISMDTSQAITGYSKLIYAPPGSGILKGLPNTYNLVGNSEVPAGDYTHAQIAAFVNSDLVEVTQNANAVTQLILKT